MNITLVFRDQSRNLLNQVELPNDDWQKYDIFMIHYIIYDCVVTMTHVLPSKMKYMLPHTGYE